MRGRSGVIPGPVWVRFGAMGLALGQGLKRSKKKKSGSPQRAQGTLREEWRNRMDADEEGAGMVGVRATTGLMRKMEWEVR